LTTKSERKLMKQTLPLIKAGLQNKQKQSNKQGEQGRQGQEKHNTMLTSMRSF
jgi:hypothetical protein